MRYQGKLKNWNGERGFGFIVADDGGQDIFVHASAFPRDGTPPTDGELLCFEVQPDRDGKKKAVRVSRLGAEPPAHARPLRSLTPTAYPGLAPNAPKRMGRTHKKSGLGSKLILLLILAALGWYGYSHYASRTALRRVQPAIPSAQFNAPPPAQAATAPPAAPPASPPALAPATAPAPAPMSTPTIAPMPANFQCDSRKYCSQMTSCAEAKLFLRNCADVEMDGNGDGVPCEQQWCTGPLAK